MNDTILEIKNLSLIKNDFVIFDDINFSLERGSYMAIIGPNGSGKTSLLKTIIGLILQTKGEILIEGTSNKNLSADKIAYVPQIKTLDRTFPALSIELVLSGFKHKWSWNISKNDRNKALEYLDRVNALHLADRKLAELSGGELQRIYLARSLAKKPVILLLDEPATGIDLVCEQSINTILNEYNKIYRTTIIMVTHDWSSAYHHTKTCLLINKKQIFYGNSKIALTEENLQKTFSHPEHKHGVTFGLKEIQ